MSEPLNIILSAGGTGGHLFPTFCLARSLKLKYPNIKIIFIGSGRPLEAKIMGQEVDELLKIKATGVKGQGFIKKIKGFALAFYSFLETLFIVHKKKPILVFCAGGYVTGPIGLSAWICRIPLLIHEQNSKPGITNKILAKFANKVLISFKESAKDFKESKIVFTGNPIRTEIEELHFLKHYDFTDPINILIMGGSQGASKINEAAVEALKKLDSEGFKIKIYHQSGEKDLNTVKKAYEGIKSPWEVHAFISDMPKAYKEADLAICRAGAMTLAELCAVKLPSILIPYAFASDDHQTFNATPLLTKGAALLIPEKELNSENLYEQIKNLLLNRSNLKNMSEAAKNMAVLGADKVIAEVADSFIKKDERVSSFVS